MAAPLLAISNLTVQFRVDSGWVTAIELIETRGRMGLFRLTPDTGKQHQLRLHMTSIGAPIVGDCVDPETRARGC